MSDLDARPVAAEAPAATLARALQMTVRMGNVELASDGAVSEGCWSMCDALLDALIAQLRNEPGASR